MTACAGSRSGRATTTLARRQAPSSQSARLRGDQGTRTVSLVVAVCVSPSLRPGSTAGVSQVCPLSRLPERTDVRAKRHGVRCSVGRAAMVLVRKIVC
eukprot:scaffold81902_cov67-Phaeocystis_antarctica.AAC.4